MTCEEFNIILTTLQESHKFEVEEGITKHYVWRISKAKRALLILNIAYNSDLQIMAQNTSLFHWVISNKAQHNTFWKLLLKNKLCILIILELKWPTRIAFL